ncbi:MAG: hypothetical protein ACKO4M_04275, partial [Betaproteobacteria bacterium]
MQMKKWLINLASAGLLLFAIGATPIVSAEDAAPAAAAPAATAPAAAAATDAAAPAADAAAPAAPVPNK